MDRSQRIQSGAELDLTCTDNGETRFMDWSPLSCLLRCGPRLVNQCFTNLCFCFRLCFLCCRCSWWFCCCWRVACSACCFVCFVLCSPSPLPFSSPLVPFPFSLPLPSSPVCRVCRVAVPLMLCRSLPIPALFFCFWFRLGSRLVGFRFRAGWRNLLGVDGCFTCSRSVPWFWWRLPDLPS